MDNGYIGTVRGYRVGAKEINNIHEGMKVIHYKGGIYTILHQGTHSETGEDMIIYQNDADKRIWIRPLQMFYETVEVKGEDEFRFMEVELYEEIELPKHYQ